MSNKWIPGVIAVFFFLVAFFILLHQKLTFGLWFQIGDLHHETFAITAFTFGLGILVGWVVAQENSK